MGKRRKGSWMTIAEIRQKVGLDESAEFMGYGVQHVPSEDFLALYQQYGGIETWGWSAAPENALRYPEYDQARLPAKRYGSTAQIILMFDLGAQVHIVPVY